MNDWTAGYTADIDYTFGYYAELNPLRARLAILNAGLVPPDQGFHCELGFGQGMSANIHAAASGDAWYATDFNPVHASFAQSIARASGANIQLFDEAFADFCSRTDLPDFDSIGLHGIWSWISDENRGVISDFIRRKLRVGGVLYISYNTQPGWASFIPMRHLMTEHARTLGSEGTGIVSRIDGALAFTEKLLATNPAYALAYPQITERIREIKNQDRHYLAHEYFNRDWLPMHFATMAQWLEPAKVSFACSACYLDHVDAINLSVEQQTLLKEIPDTPFRETVRDFMVNQRFRRDYWIKGARRLSTLEQAEALGAQKVILTRHRADISLTITGSNGDSTMLEEIYTPILDVLSDHKSRTLDQIDKAIKDTGVTFAQITQAVMLLTGSGALAAAQEDTTISKAQIYTDRFNRHLMDKARGSGEMYCLASPVTGCGITVNRFQQLFLLAFTQGKQQPEEWAKEVWRILSSQGQRIIKAGETLETPEANLAELELQAAAFAEKLLPILKALKIA
jgi:SAM-dependent methyltransferase